MMAVQILCFIVSVLIIIFVSHMLNQFVKYSPKNIKNAVYFICVLCVVCPCFINSFWTEENYGRLDMYALLATLVGVCIFNKVKNIYLKYFSLAVVCLLSNAIYQGFVFMYFSFVVIIMLEDILKDSKIQIKKVASGSFVAFTAIASFLVFQFLDTIKFNSAEEMVSYLKLRSDIPINEYPIQTEFFGSIKSLYGFMMGSLMGTESLREHLFTLLIFLLPLVILILRIVFGIIKKETSQKPIIRSAFLLSSLTLLFVIPQFIMNVDWGRWLTTEFLTVIFLITYFAYKGNPAVIDTLETVSAEIKQHKLRFTAVLIYCSVFSAFEARYFSSDLGYILQIEQNVKDFISSIF